MDDLRLITIEELCDLLQVKRQWVYDAVHRGELPYVKLGKLVRFRPAELESYI